MREARRALKLNQVDFYDKFVGSDRIKLRTYQRAETGANEAGMMLVESFVRAGINANWLLTGEGPMLLADLAPRPAPQVKINVEALATAVVAMQKLAKAGEAAESTARKAAEFYQYCLDQGLITPDGLGNGHLKQAG